MKYLRKFATEADIDVDASPNVVLVAESGVVRYDVKPYGVYIQHIGGKLYTKDEWIAKAFANGEANGVAVKTKNMAVVVAKDPIVAAITWQPKSQLVDGCYTTMSEAEAILDFNGFSNTEAILKVAEDGAAVIARQYTFPNGAMGYLPSCGEMNEIYINDSLVNSALSLIGGKNLNIGNYAAYNSIWTSTQGGATSAYMFNNRTNGNFRIDRAGKTETCHVRPFTTLVL